MRVGFTPLWWAWIKHSNDFHFAVGWSLTQNHDKTIAYSSLWSSTIFGKNGTNNKKTFWNIINIILKALFMLITMVQFPASYSIHIPRYDMCPSFETGYMECANVWAIHYARYLGLGMRYGAGICTILISMNGAFKWCPFCCRLNFDPKSWKKSGWVRFWAKMRPTMKNILGHLLKAVFMLITMARFPVSYLILIPRYNVTFVIMNTDHTVLYITKDKQLEHIFTNLAKSRAWHLLV